MEARKTVQTYPKADIQLWGKGYRITADSEEFQRYVPKDSTQPKNLEKKLQTFLWGSLLEPLYSLREKEIADQRCVLFDASDLMSVSFAKTEDRHRRPSLLLTTCTVGIDWRNPLLGSITARAVALSSRLATTYAETLRGNPELVGKQLRDNSFLASRSFDLTEENPDQAIEWAHVISAVRKWSGITGISTPRLVALGANVVFGTQYEAERIKQQLALDGFFDVRHREIKTLSDRLNPWEPEPEPPVESSAAPPTYPPSADFRWIAEGLQQVANSVDRLADVATEILDRLTREKHRR